MATVPFSDHSIRINLAEASAGPFELGFRIFDTDLTVYVDEAVVDTGWSLTATFADGYADDATITFSDVLPKGTILRILGDLQPLRALDYIKSDPNLTDKLNIELGRIWSKIQELYRDGSNSLRTFRRVEPGFIAEGKTLIIEDGILAEGPSVEDISGAYTAAAAAAASAAEAEAVVDGLMGSVITGYTGDGSTTEFALTFAVVVSNQLAVYVDGIRQYATTFSVTDDVLTFSEAPGYGSKVEVVSRLSHEISTVSLAQVIAAGGTVGFSTRAALKAWADANTPDAGTIMGGGGYLYAYDGTSTLIPDMPGWFPADSDYFVEHWGAVGDGSTDDAEKILNAFGYTHRRETGDGSTTLFTLPISISNSTYFAVRIDGRPDDSWVSGGTPGSGQYAGSGTVLTFNTAPAADAVIDIYCRLSGAEARNVRFDSDTYAVSCGLVVDRGTWTASKHGTKILGLSASMPETAAILDLGEFTVISGFTVGFDSLTGSEAQDERVGLSPQGYRYGIQKGDSIGDMFFERVGTAISDFGSRGFSVTFGNIRIKDFSFAGLDFRETTSTGNIFHNVYMYNGDENPASGSYETYTPSFGIRFTGNHQGGSFILVNVEHCSFTNAAVWMEGVVGLPIDSLHMEGVRLTGTAPATGRHFVYMQNSTVVATAFNIINTHIYHNDHSIVTLGEAASMESYSGRSVTSSFHADTMQVKGLANAEDSASPGTYSELVGLDNVSDFKLFRRYGSTTKDYKVSVGMFDFKSYGARTAELPFIRYADLTNSDSDLIEFTNFNGRGTQVPGRPSLLKNGDFLDWAAGTSIQVQHSDGAAVADRTAETADGWMVTTGLGDTAGDITVTQQLQEMTYDGAHFLRFDVDAADTYQALYQRMPNPKRFWSQASPNIDRYLTLSFWARGESAGAFFEAIQIQRILGSGGSGGTGYTKFVDDPAFTTAWKFFSYSILMPDEPASIVYGTGEAMELRFVKSSATANGTGYADLRDVKLEYGEEPTTLRRMI